MNDDIVERLRQTHRVGCEAADEIERLRKELGQVSDADSWVSTADAAYLDSLLNWCEFNAMEWHRALQRLVNDRARLRGEVNRLRKLSGDSGKLIEERDEARRLYINEMCLREFGDTSSRISEAKLRGWDCFEEVKP